MSSEIIIELFNLEELERYSSWTIICESCHDRNFKTKEWFAKKRIKIIDLKQPLSKDQS